MLRYTRRAAVTALTALALTACGSADSNNTNGETGPATDAAIVEDVILGRADAPITLIEYASWTCPHCAQFHIDVMPMIKADYIDTGKVRFVFREFPTAPANIAIAGFAIGRCAGPDKYYDVLDELFERQSGILSMVRQGDQVKAALQQIAENHGISGEDAFDACLQDATIRRTISTAIARGDAAGVDSTPTLLLNGEILEGYDWRYAEGMKAILDEALGESAPAGDAAGATETTTDEAGE